MASTPDEATRTVQPPSSAGTSPGAPQDSEETPLPRGTQVGRYVVIDVVGGGGMGYVYSAYDPELDRRIALKLLRRVVAGPDAQTRLLREAQAMARLAHPNVVTVFDAGVHQGRVFLAMEYVPGVTLRDWLREAPRTFREKLSVLLDAGRGLAAAHAAHLVHRDFKPGNVIVGKDGRVRVTDFGVAREEGGARPGHTPEEAARAMLEAIGAGVRRETSLSDPLTMDGAVVGTVGYMAPEQFLSEPTDARTDQFSFCITAWQTLYGERPFVGEIPSAIMKALLDGTVTTPTDTGDVPRWVMPVLRRGLSPKPDQRFPSMEALLAELGRDRYAAVRAVGPWVALGLLLVGLVAGVGVNRTRAAAACEGAGARLGGAWDPGVRGRVQGAFGKVTAPWAADLLRSVERGLDAWAKAWVEQKTSACEATRVEGKQPEDVLALRDACLERRLDELRALTALLGEADAAAAERALTAVYALRPPATCADIDRLRRAGEGKVADGAEARLRELLDKARALSDLGQFAKARPLFEQAATDALSLSRRGLAAESQLGMAQALQQAGKFPEARDAWAQALENAQAVGLDELVARAALGLAAVIGFHVERPEEGRRWLAVARASIDRLGGDERLSVDLLRVECKLLHAEGRNAEAPPRYEEALAAARKALGAEHPEVWRVQFDLGTAYISVKQWRKAADTLEAAAAAREATSGPEHPEVALALANLGTARFYLGDVEGSRAAFGRALAIRERAFGKESPRLAPLLGNMGDTAMRAGRLAEARPHLERALKLCLAAFGPTHTYTLGTRINLATLALREGHAKEALAHLEPALAPGNTPQLLAEANAVRAQVALAEKKPADARRFAEAAVAAGEKAGKDTGDLVGPLLALGEVLLEARQQAAAQAPLERALTLAQKTHAWPVLEAEVKLALARALKDGDAARARTLAAEAEKTFSEAPGQQAHAQEAKAFLAALK